MIRWAYSIILFLFFLGGDGYLDCSDSFRVYIHITLIKLFIYCADYCMIREVLKILSTLKEKHSCAKSLHMKVLYVV